MNLKTIASSFLLTTFLVGGMATEAEAVTLPETTTHTVTYTIEAGYNLGTWHEPSYPIMTVSATFDGYYGELTLPNLDGYAQDRIWHDDGSYTVIDTSDVLVIAEGSTVTYHLSCEEVPEITENAILDGRVTNLYTTDTIPFDWVSGCGQMTTPSEDFTSLSVWNQVRTVYSYTQVEDATFRFFPTAGLTRLTMVTGGNITQDEMHGILGLLNFDKVLIIHQEGIDQLIETGEAHFERETSDFIQQTRAYPGLLELLGGTSSEPTTPEPTTPNYAAWAEPQVNFSQENGLTVDSLGLDYTKNITRLQIADLLVNMVEKTSGETLPTSDEVFTDTSSEAVSKASKAGIISGKDVGIFAPDATATRQEISIMIVRAIEKLEELSGESYIDHSLTSLEGFADFSDTADWAKSFVAILANNGIMSGSDGNLTPLSATSIQECLVLNNNLFQLGK